MFWDPGSNRGTISRPEKKFLLGSKQKNVLHFAQKIRKTKNLAGEGIEVEQFT
jgi:hypothetical protein